MYKERVIVSLTTYCKRIANIPVVLDTIFAQTMPPDIVVLNLAIDEVIPDDVKDYIETHSIEVNRVYDTKVYKKLIPTLKRYPNDCIISIDDDWLYPDGMIEDFMHIHSLYPEFPISGNKSAVGNMQCHCGCASLTKASYFGKWLDLIDSDVIQHCSSDDIVYTFMANKAGNPYIITENDYFVNMSPYGGDHGYSDSIVDHDGIVKSLDYLVARFGSVTTNLVSSYMKDTNMYLASVIESVQTNTCVRYGRLMEEQGYWRGVKEMKSSRPFRIGQAILSPLKIFVKKL